MHRRASMAIVRARRGPPGTMAKVDARRVVEEPGRRPEAAGANTATADANPRVDRTANRGRQVAQVSTAQPIAAASQLNVDRRGRSPAGS